MARSQPPLLRLSEIPQVVAVKEASGNVTQMCEICASLPDDFIVLSGDDALTLPLMAVGGRGIISVASNEIPREMATLCRAALDGRWDEARSIHARWLPLFRANFAGAPNPVPVKAALVAMGLIRADAVRQPLLPLDDVAAGRLRTLLRDLALVGGGGRLAEIEAVA